MTKIFFVCHEIFCRSPMAEFVLKRKVADPWYTNDFQVT